MAMNGLPLEMPTKRRGLRFTFICGGLLAISTPTAAESAQPADLAAASLEQLARWGEEWDAAALAEREVFITTGLSNSMIERPSNPDAAALSLDCDTRNDSERNFWSAFRDSFSTKGLFAAETISLAWRKWKQWETFTDGMDFAGAWDGRAIVPLAGEYDTRGNSVHTPVHSKRDWIKAMQQSQWQLLHGKQPNWSEDNLIGFLKCPVGFVLVQYVVYMVQKTKLNLPLEQRQEGVDSVLCAFDGLVTGVLDHLESSNWNASSFDLAVNLNVKTGEDRYFASYDHYFQARPTPLPRLTSWREDWPEHRAWLGPAACRTWGRRQGGPEPLRVALVGEHGSSNLEHLSALTAALAEATSRDNCDAGALLPDKISVGHFFTYLWSLAGVAEGDEIQKSLRMTWEAFWGEPMTASAGRSTESNKTLWTVERAVWTLREYAHREPFLRAAQLIVCSEPLWLCVLLHAARGSQGLLIRAAGAGRAMCLLWHFDQLFGASELPNYWPLVRAMAADMLPRGTLSATSRMTAEMLEYQAGIRAPYVPILSLHVGAAAPYAPNSSQVLFFRSNLVAGAMFRQVLQLLIAEMQPEAAPSIVFMDSAMSYAEIASYKAVAMLPHTPVALRLSDVYSMGSPLLVPDEPLIHKFVWPDDPFPLADVAVDQDAPNRSQPPYSPFEFHLEAKRAWKFLDARHYWLQFVEWRLRPHLVRFRSAREFLQMATSMSEAEARAISAKVLQSQALLKREAMEYWQAATAAAAAT